MSLCELGMKMQCCSPAQCGWAALLSSASFFTFDIWFGFCVLQPCAVLLVGLV